MVKKFEKGDIILVDFDPQAGHEQSGRRPAIVISNVFFNQKTAFVVACPITSKHREHPLHIQLDERTKTQGTVMIEQLKSIDIEARNARFLERIPDDLLEEITDIVSECF